MANAPTRVLVIEGDADEAALIAAYLAESGDGAERFELTQAPRLSTACHLLQRRTFDAILIDLVLPRSVGLESFRRVRELRPAAPIIVLTGLRDAALAAEAVRLGAQDYFIKGTPDFCLIKRSIRYALENRRLTDAIENLIGADDAPKLVADDAGVVRYANAAARLLFGRATEEIVNKPFGQPLPPGAGETAIPAPRAPGKMLGLRVRPISWNGAPARLITLRDVDTSEQLKRLEAEIKEGLRVVEVKNHFMSHVSHELRNTLSTLATAAYCLKDGPAGSLTAQQSRLVEMISRNVERQTKIVENVLDLARFQSGKLKIRFRPVDLTAVVAQIVEESALAGAGPRVHVDLDGRLPSIHGDPDLLAQLLRNLLDNALRFARDKVVVEASPEGVDGVSIRVVDDGDGIPAERLADLFTEFVQLERAKEGPRRNGYKGTGLGLTICKEIVEGHRGRIWADNAPGRGARFSVVLPVRAAPENAFVPDDDLVLVPAPRSDRDFAASGDHGSHAGHK